MDSTLTTTLQKKLTKRAYFLISLVIMIHLVAFSTLYFYGLKWILITYLIGSPVGLGVTVTLHRYFAHRSFKTSPIFECVLLWMSSMTGFKVLEWVSNHRWHHAYSDSQEDIHSPLHGGFWWSHFQWAFYEFPIQKERVQDLLTNPRVSWFNRYWWIPNLTYALVVIVSFWILDGSLNGLYKGLGVYCLTLMMLWHIEGSVNSVTHLWGFRRFKTKDNSRNNPLVGVLSMGEGWHNNHHHQPTSARLGFYWYEIDLGYYFIYLLEKLGLVWNVKKPTT